MKDDLTDFEGIGNKTASRIRAETSVQDVDDLARASPEELGDVKGVSEEKAAKIIREVNQEAVLIKSGEEVAEEYENLNRISTGIKKLDDALNGGWEEGHCVAIGGESGSGKTQLCFQALGEAVASTGEKAVYIETEKGRYRGKRIAEMYDEEVQKKVFKVEAYSQEQQRVAYEKVRAQFDDLSLVVVDSFTARFRLSDKYESRGDYSDRSDDFGDHLTALEALSGKMNCPILLTCQVYENPTPYGPAFNLYGGSLMMHTVNFVMMLKGAQGALTTATIRNHPNAEEQEIELQITEDGVQVPG